MIDTFSIFLSTGLCMLVIFRAVKLDRLMPWFPSRDMTRDPLSTDPAIRGRRVPETRRRRSQA